MKKGNAYIHKTPCPIFNFYFKDIPAYFSFSTTTTKVVV